MCSRQKAKGKGNEHSFLSGGQSFIWPDITN